MIAFSTQLSIFALISTSFIQVSAVATIPRSVIALAPRLTILPENHDATHIAIDETNGEYVAFRKDWSVYGVVPFDRHVTGQNGTSIRSLPIARRDVGTCSDLSTDEAQTMPAWSKMQAQANANWGGGSYNLVTNPPEYLDYPAQACISQDPVNLALDGTPNCVTEHQAQGGNLANTNGTLELDNVAGFTGSATHTVTKTSSLAEAVTLECKVDIPDLFEVTGSSTTTLTLTNQESDASTTSVDATTTQKVSEIVPTGKDCHLELDTSTCSVTGKGSIQTTAQGWIWFNFDSATNGHYKWALSIEGTLPDPADRSSSVEFTSSITSTSQGNFTGVCE